MRGIGAQLKELWRELGVNQRVSLILAALVVVGGMAGMMLWASRPQMTLLFGGLSTQDMADVVNQLEKTEQPYEIRNGTAIYVQSDAVYKLRMSLASEGLPTGGGIGFEIFDEKKWGMNEFQQQTSLQRALQGELQRTIAQLKGVRSARVLLVLPEKRVFDPEGGVKASASVQVDTGGTLLPFEAVNSIRFLVASSVMEMQPENVVVTDTAGNLLTADMASDSLVGQATGRFKFRRSIEEYFTRKVETMLERVLGAGNVVARISVEIDDEALTQVDEIYDPDGQVVREQTSTDDSMQSTETRRRDVVGVTANTPLEENPGGEEEDLVSATEEKQKNRKVSYEINRTTTERVKQPGSVERVTAAVFIARRTSTSAEGEVTQQPRTPEELTEIRQMVMNALGVIETDGSQPTVTVSEIDFAQVPASEPGTLDSLEGNFSRYFGLLREFLAIGVAGVMFFVFVRLLRKHRPDSSSLQVMEDQDDDDVLREASDVTPRLTPDLLNELIREKPENVSSALRTWVSAQGQ